jgi:parallel beta-helix repeat protein
MRLRTFAALTLGLVTSHPSLGAELHVSLQGHDSGAGTAAATWRTIQHACDQAKAGDTIVVAPGIYEEKVIIDRSGSASHPIVLKGEPGAVISGKGVSGPNMILIEDQSYVQVIGFEIRDNLEVKDGSGIRVEGKGSHIELRNNRIHNIRGRDAMGITIYGTNAKEALEHIIIDGNEVYECDPARSEALTLNGNVSNFKVTNNIVRDMNNIGIDFIGGEAWTSGDASKVARNGLCKGNRVFRCRSTYGGGYAAGIYVDGGRDIVIEDNIITQCDLGIEIGAENKGTVTGGIVVRNNKIFLNDKAGLVFGGYEGKAGRVKHCTFVNNLCYRNNQHREDHNGELWIQWASENEVRGNTFAVNDSDSPLAQLDSVDAANNQITNNHYFTEAGTDDAFFVFKGEDVNGFAAWQSATGLDAGSVFAPVEVALPAVE